MLGVGVDRATLKRADNMKTMIKTFAGDLVGYCMAVLMAVFAYLTYSREKKARRVADERAAEYQRELQVRIEELDKANKELLQMRSVEKFAATGRIARTMAHEVRNPLTNINLAIEQLQMELDGHATRSSDVLLQMIGRNSDRINGLITDLLNSTKFTDLRYQRISMHELIDDTLELARDRIQLNHVTVIKNYTEDKCHVSVDVKRMKIALLNIIVNALEAMEPGQGILQIKTTTANHKCQVSIADNGPGIDEESLPKVFEPYFTSKAAGTGLGLTNTQNIILNHNGVISLESKKGVGTTFTIQLQGE
jgi:signal transduction histidine kinase